MIVDDELSPEQQALIAEKRAAYEAGLKKNAGDVGGKSGGAGVVVASDEASDAGSYPPGATLCHKCNTTAMIVMDGCQTCLACGYSKCGWKLPLRSMLYKFRSLSNVEFVLDILGNERLYCSAIAQLNDPFEGQFVHLMQLPKGSLWECAIGSSEMVVAGDFNYCFEGSFPRVCSLSRALSDVRMWSLYADGHKGIAIEVELPAGAPVHEVAYSRALPTMPSIGERKALSNDHAISLLTTKTEQWSYEREWRLISQEQHYSLHGVIRRVIFGFRSPKELRVLLMKLFPQYTFALARLNYATTEVEVFGIDSQGNQEVPVPRRVTD
jgi:hypothetical protein